MSEDEKANVDVSELYDAVVVGGGPAGLTAALYLARARYRVLVLEKERFGGQIVITDEVVNYPGVFKTSGAELTETMRKQAESFGAEFMMTEATGLDMSGDVKVVHTKRGDIQALAVLMATGASPRKAGFQGEEEFQGHGVAYCATCDGEFFTGKEVFVIGGGFAAAEEAVFLTKYARHVTILVRRDRFSCAQSTADEAMANEKISVRFNTAVESVSGDHALRRIAYRDTATGETGEFVADEGDSFGLFVFTGYEPATGLADGVAEVDEQGWIVVGDDQQTTAPGLFAAGDLCKKPLRQVATAVGQAASTATEMERYLKEAQERTGLVPQAKPVAKRDEGMAETQSGAENAQSSDSALFDEGMLQQLEAVFDRMESSVVLRVHLDDRTVSKELEGYANELASLTEKVSFDYADTASDDSSELPYVEICRADGTPSGASFHGVPGGHEFTSFVLGLYNVAGPGQQLEEADKVGIAALDENVEIGVIVSLTCTMCPDLVVASQRLAAENEHVTTDVYDVAHFPDLKDKYNVMSVPCLVVKRGDSEEKVTFGKKNIGQLLEFING